MRDVKHVPDPFLRRAEASGRCGTFGNYLSVYPNVLLRKGHDSAQSYRFRGKNIHLLSNLCGDMAITFEEGYRLMQIKEKQTKMNHGQNALVAGKKGMVFQ